MLRLIKEADIHGELHDIFERTGLILNCVNSPSEKNKLESVGIGGNFEVMAEIPVLPAFKTRDNTIPPRTSYGLRAHASSSGPLSTRKQEGWMRDFSPIKKKSTSAGAYAPGAIGWFAYLNPSSIT